MIPTTDNLQSINPEIVELAKKFPERIKSWKQKIKELPSIGFIIIPEIDSFREDEHLFDEDGVYGQDYNFHTDEYLMRDIKEKDLILRCCIFLTKPQWRNTSYWPDCYPEGNGHPPVVMASFYGVSSSAEVMIDFPTGYDVQPEDEELMWPREEIEIQGNWEEVYNHLVKLTEKAMSLITIPETDG